MAWRSVPRRPSWWQPTHQWHQHRDQSKCTEALDCHKFQVPGLSYNWWRFHAGDTLQNSIDNSSIDKVEFSLEWQEYFSQFQDITDLFLTYIEKCDVMISARPSGSAWACQRLHHFDFVGHLNVITSHGVYQFILGLVIFTLFQDHKFARNINC